MYEVTLDFILLILIRVVFILSVLASCMGVLLVVLIRGTHARCQPRDRNDTIMRTLMLALSFIVALLVWFKEREMRDEFCEKYTQQDIERITPWLRK